MRSVSGVARGFVFVAVLLLAMATAYAPPAHSQPLYNHKGTFEIGGGTNSPVGEINPYLNSSGSFFFGGGRNLNQSSWFQGILPITGTMQAHIVLF